MADQHLHVFVTVAEMENFSRAAEQLHMTQPAVSQYIRLLEQTVGARLLDRSNKYVRLTKAGEIVYHHAKEIIGLHTRMQNLVDDLSNKASGNLAIGASYTFGEYVLPHIIAELKRKYPEIHPMITIGNTKEIAEKVSGRLLDVGIVEGEVRQPQLRLEPFADDAMFIISSTRGRWAQQGEVTVQDLQSKTWIVREAGSGTREAADNLFAAFQMVPMHVLEFGSTQIIKEAVEAGLGVTLLSKWTIRKELALGSLCTVKVRGTPYIRKFSLIRQETPFYTKAMELFCELTVQHMASLDQQGGNGSGHSDEDI
ncbi:LysR family transcriptional regulator [Paenibacillus allorhizosphaerae]|uniref:HTH-type transcriptional regulator CysL n=1 Tax=Paenibacillus allorhizosphaerae TaxID=2849866 RepID=A0ABN7TKN7_9BACL|nr:LysR family transcriptional regulator [Paenibacillus allorhizosphaerae]CAG7644272.1 HTH-type transcriptional regulator CysL [Paenibacillus allorhizosphaerae]